MIAHYTKTQYLSKIKQTEPPDYINHMVFLDILKRKTVQRDIT